jgi:hypothetical protein
MDGHLHGVHMENRSLALKCFLGGALVAALAMLALRAPAQTAATNAYLGTYADAPTLAASMPANTVAVGTHAILLSGGMVYSDGSNWVNVYPRISVATASIGSAILLLGSCTSETTVSTPGVQVTSWLGASPQTAQPFGVLPSLRYIDANTVGLKICGALAVTTVTSLWNVKVLN